MCLLFLLLCLTARLLSIHAAPNAALATRDNSGAENPPDGVPPLVYPGGGDGSTCPTQYTNLWNQGIQKRTAQLSEDMSTLPAKAPALQPRALKNCQNIAHFSWTGFNRASGNTQDVFLWGGSTYLFSVSSSVSIDTAYAWSPGFGSDNYTIVGTGGDGGKTATIAFNLTQGGGKHIHFQAISKETLSNGLAAVFKQDS